jgi:hypothetical protein
LILAVGITSEQIEAFDRTGYLHLRDWIPLPLLARTRFAPSWIEARLRLAELEKAVAAGASPRNRTAVIEAAYAGRAPHEGGNYS